MDEVDEETVEIRTVNNGSRKRRVTGGKRAAKKREKYSAPKISLFYPCQHNTKQFQCYKITPNDVNSIREELYKEPDKLRQDSMIASLVTTTSIKRRRPRPVQVNKRQKAGTQHGYSTKFYMMHGPDRVPVCKKFFMSLMRFKRTRLANITKSVFSGKAIEEHRGGDRVSFKNSEKKNSIRDFIKKLKGTESHYNRNKSKRIYLNCDLSISKLHKIYNSECTENLKVKYSMFRLIFVTEFNIGFRSPASDVCSYCTLLVNQIKRATDIAQKNSWMIEKRIHKKRANAFYQHLKADVPDSKTLCFDLQQIQPLPKTQIQEAYYARQIGFYALCIVDTKTCQPDFYTWTEEQAGKGSVEVSSALLQHLEKMNLTNTKVLRLFSDGCVSQNKNNIVLRTLMHFLYKRPKLEIVFITPVRGHSFLPADRVFGRVEHMLRLQPTILSKHEYYEIYKQVGTVHKLGVDWKLLDTKSLNAVYKDLPMISDMKKIQIKHNPDPTKTQVLVKASKYFNYEDQSEVLVSLVKRGVKKNRLNNFKIKELSLSHGITQEKKDDVNKLLTNMFGEWQSLDDDYFAWYKQIIFGTPSRCHSMIESQNVCDCLEAETAIHI